MCPREGNGCILMETENNKFLNSESKSQEDNVRATIDLGYEFQLNLIAFEIHILKKTNKHAWRFLK